MSSEWELCVAAKLLTNFKHLEWVSNFLLTLKKKDSLFIRKKNRIALAGVVGLDNLNSN